MSLILFAGGGSVGHIAPAIAVWEELKKMQSNVDALFLCADRPDERDFLTARNLKFHVLNAPRASAALPWKFWLAMLAANRLLTAHHPTVIFSTGGYISLPVCAAAFSRRIPIILHESDAVPGRANMLIGIVASRISAGLTDEPLRGRLTVTGNPIRPEVTQGSRETGLRLTGFSGQRPILLVAGGSQGAQALNEAVADNIQSLLSVCDIIHITGRGKKTSVASSGYWQSEFVTTEIPHLYACADMALSRAGAGMIGELAANGIATIFCPLRDVGHDHQQANADLVLATGGCIVIQQPELSSRLVDTVSALAASAEQRRIVGENLRKLHHSDAAQKIAGIIANSLNNNRH